MRTGWNRRSGTSRVGSLAALCIISGLVFGCGDSAEKPADVSQPSAARRAGHHEAGSPSIRTRPLPGETTEVSITADAVTAQKPMPPVLLAPGLTEPPREPPSSMSKESRTEEAEPGDDTAEIGPVDAASAEAFDALAAAYRDHQPADYESAEGRLVARGEAAVPVLLQKLTDPHAETRELASMMVLRIVPETILVDVTYPLDRRTAVLARLEKALDDPSADVRANVASTLALFPEDLPAVLPALRKLLSAAMPYQRLMAAVAIGNLGPKAAAARADVVKLLEDGDADVRTAAEQTLELIRPLGE